MSMAWSGVAIASCIKGEQFYFAMCTICATIWLAVIAIESIIRNLVAEMKR